MASEAVRLPAADLSSAGVGPRRGVPGVGVIMDGPCGIKDQAGRALF